MSSLNRARLTDWGRGGQAGKEELQHTGSLSNIRQSFGRASSRVQTHKIYSSASSILLALQ